MDDEARRDKESAEMEKDIQEQRNARVPPSEPADPMEWVNICVNCWDNKHDRCDYHACECPHDSVRLQRMADERRLTEFNAKP